MNTAIKSAERLTQAFISDDSFQLLSAIFQSSKPFLSAVKDFDAWVKNNPDIAPVEEYLFDLLLAHHLEMQRGNEDYFETKEWLDIEDKTIDRGTELLNLLLYISEAQETDVDIDIEDFLYEFLLVDEDEFQDEYRIYEQLIDNVELIDEDNADFLIALKNMETGELGELYKPLLVFFKSPYKAIDTKDTLNKVEVSIYDALLAY